MKAFGTTALLLASTAMAGAAQAQSAPAPAVSPAPSQDGEVLQEIVVTAQRRSENLQNVPVAITAVTGAALRESNTVNAVDLAKAIPNVQIKSGFASSNPTIFMRGIGINDFNAASAGAIGVTLDEVFLNSTVGQLFQIYDLDRVEVLKGPQGTLYGRNTTGGVISFYTRKPSFELNPSIQVTYGRFNEVDIEAGTSLPIVDEKVAGRVSVSYRRRDGYSLNALNGRRYNDADAVAGRAQLLFTPTDRLEILAKFETGFNRSTVFTGSGLGTFDPLTGATCSPARIRAGNQCANALGAIGSGDPDRNAYDVFRQPERLDTYSGRLGVTWRGDGVSVTSISGWNLNKRDYRQDIDSSPVRLLEQPLGRDRAEQETQEIRIASADGSPLRWIVGGFFLHERLDSATGYEIGAGANPTPTASYLDPTGATTGGLPVFSVERNYRQTTTSYALFTHLNFDLAESLKATVGARYSWDRKRITLQSVLGPVDSTLRLGAIPDPVCCLVGDPASVDPTTGLPTRPIRDRLNFSRPTWNLSIDYKPGDTLFYASYARGVRSGGFNAAALTDPLEYSRVSPEKIDSFELGFKSDLSRRLRWNTTAFYYTGELQVFTLRQGSLVPIQILGSAGVEGYGLESEVQVAPLKGLTASAFLGLFHGRYTSFPGQPSFVGKKLVQAPDISLSGSIRYEHEVGGNWKTYAGADASYQSRVYFQPSNDAVQTHSPYALVNARVGITRDERLDLSLWVKNLTDRRYLVDIFDTSSFGFYQANFSLPRTFGAAISFHY